MLVLTRKLEEQIRIGDDITISILRVKGNTVRVGIDAPRTVRVVRGELPTHSQAEPSLEATSTLVREPARVDVAENASSDDDTSRGDREKPDPATTAVRRFIASRTRRRNRLPTSKRSDSKPLAASLTRSA